MRNKIIISELHVSLQLSVTNKDRNVLRDTIVICIMMKLPVVISNNLENETMQQ